MVLVYLPALTFFAFNSMFPFSDNSYIESVVFLLVHDGFSLDETKSDDRFKVIDSYIKVESADKRWDIIVENFIQKGLVTESREP